MANEEMFRRWNEQFAAGWVRMQPRLDAQIAPLAEPLLDEVEKGETVLDVGCGCAQTTLALAERVDPEGHVTGIDVARPMLEQAEERARKRGTRNVDFVAADAQTHPLPENTVDRAYFALSPAAPTASVSETPPPAQARRLARCP